jgi:hypothetical protein
MTPLAIIGIGLAAMFFGYGFGLFEGRGQGYKKRRQEEASDPTLRPVIQPAPAPAPTPPVPANDHTLLRLSLNAREQPCLDMDGQRIDTSRMEPQERKRLIDLMVLMRPWIEGGPVAPRSQPAPASAPSAAPRPVVTPQPVPPPAAATPPAGSPAEPTVAPTTMVGQIDAILQTRLIGTPLATRGIRLVESMQGGAMVMVGLNRYSGVGDVPDPEVQAAIRAAIAEWEKKYTPG